MLKLGLTFLFFTYLLLVQPSGELSAVSIFLGLLILASSLTLTLLRDHLQEKPRLQEALRLSLAAFCCLLGFLYPETTAYLPLLAFDYLPDFVFSFSLPRRELAADEEIPPSFLWPRRCGAVSLLPLVQGPDLAGLLLCVILGILGVFYELSNQRHLGMHRLRDSFEFKRRLAEQELRRERENRERSQELARLDERNRISRRLHDVIGHTLSSALLQVGALEVLNQDERLRAPLTQLHGTLDWGMSSIREAIHDLHADSCDLPLELTTALKRATGFETKLYCPEETNELPLPLRLDILSLVREAVTNAVRHSGGTRIEVQVTPQPGLVGIDIRDNGHGLPPELLHKGLPSGGGTGLGLSNLESWVKRNDGKLSIHSSPEEGTHIHVLFFRKQERSSSCES